MTKDDFNLILLNAARKVHDADWNWKNVNSPFARLYMVESGSAKVIMPDGAYVIRPGYLYLIPAFVTHNYECDSLFIHYYFHIYNEYDIFDRLSFPFEIKIGDTDVLLVKRLLEINPDRELQRSDPKTYDNFPTLKQFIEKDKKNGLSRGIETKGILLQLISRFLLHSTSKYDLADTRIVDTLRYIRNNIDKNIHNRDLASLCRLSVDHFIRLFKKEMNCTPMQYIIQKKIEKAQIMLLMSESSIKDIAYCLSFDNITHFNRMFKKIIGVSPQKYRKQ